ncbi:MAG: 3-keto-5-aminohexanoate cleavage protein [Actinomycetota bacterium]|nr:3-keto-5-aminohexanoate cleavage protein [Actinomycetota bacterium]
MLQGCLNGARPVDAHPALPVTPYELARDARVMARHGVSSVHVHPRCSAGLETLNPMLVGDAVAAIHSALPGMEVGVPAARWVEPDGQTRVEAVLAWGRLGGGMPDVIAVNVHDMGWREVCAAAQSSGMGIELGVWTTGDAVTVRNAGLPPGTVRLVVEPTEPGVAVDEAIRILRTLGQTGVQVLVHGEDAGVWPVFDYAREHHLQARIGLEDTLLGRDGWLARGNEDLIEIALGLDTSVPRRRRVGRAP